MDSYVQTFEIEAGARVWYETTKGDEGEYRFSEPVELDVTITKAMIQAKEPEVEISHALESALAEKVKANTKDFKEYDGKLNAMYYDEVPKVDNEWIEKIAKEKFGIDLDLSGDAEM